MGLFGGKKKQQRRKGRAEPRLFEDEPPAADADANGSSPRKGGGLFRWLFKMFFALGFWGTVVAAGLFAVTWYSLDQKGLFQIPQREPGIMILASDGSEIAEQGTFFGDAVAMAELPDYVPNAIIAIEDRRFYAHFGVDPIGIARAMVQQHPARPDARRRLHPHPAIGKEPVPQP